MRHVALLALLAALAIPLAGCDLIPATPGGDALLVTVEASGGMCPQGMCASRYDVFRDGRVLGPDGGVRRIDGVTVARLAASVDGADWDAILARPFTGECPTAYDGQETTWTFRTLTGPVVVASCTVEVDPDQEPFSTLGEALAGLGG